MAKELSPEAARAAWDAELKLELLDANSDIAEFYESETITRYRESYANSYRRIVGIHPADRDEFREALIHIRDGGGVPVAEVIDILNRQ